MDKTRRTRIEFKFWLNYEHDRDRDIGGIADNLKQVGGFTQAIRDGLRLIWDLRAGRLDVLLELFPWVKDALQPQTPPTPSTGSLERQIADLKAVIMSQCSGGIPAAPPGYPTMKSGGTGRPLVTPKLAAPTFDDDDWDTIIIRRDVSTDSGANFMSAMLGLQQ